MFPIESVHPRFEFLSGGKGVLVVDRAEALPPGSAMFQPAIPIGTELYHARDGQLLHSFPPKGPGRLLRVARALMDPRLLRPPTDLMDPRSRNLFQLRTPSIVTDEAGHLALSIVEETESDVRIEVWSLAEARSLGSLGKYGVSRTIPQHLMDAGLMARFSPSGRKLLIASFPETQHQPAHSQGVKIDVWGVPSAIGGPEKDVEPLKRIGNIEAPFFSFESHFDPTEQRVLLTGHTLTGQQPTGQQLVGLLVDLAQGKILTLEGDNNGFPSTQELRFSENYLIAWEATFGGLRSAPNGWIWDIKTGDRIELTNPENWQTNPTMLVAPDANRALFFGPGKSVNDRGIHVELWDIPQRKRLLAKTLEASSTGIPGFGAFQLGSRGYAVDRKRAYLQLPPTRDNPRGRVVCWNWQDGAEVTLDVQEIVSTDNASGWILWKTRDGLAASGPEGNAAVPLERTTIASGTQRVRFHAGHVQCEEIFLDGARRSNMSVWDARTGKLVLELPDTYSNSSTDPEGRWLAATSASGEEMQVGVWEVRTGRLARTLHLPTPVEQDQPSHQLSQVVPLRLNPEGNRVVLPVNGVLQLWDANSGELVKTLARSGHGSQVTRIVQQGEWVASGDEEGIINLWNRQDGQFLHHLAGHKGAITGLAFLPSSREVLSAGEDGLLMKWNVNGKSSWSWPSEGSRVPITALAVDPTSQRAAVGHSDGRVTFLDLNTGKTIHLIEGGKTAVRAVSFDPSYRRILFGDASGGVRIWDIVREKIVRQWEEGVPVAAVSVVDDQHALVGTTHVSLRDLQTGDLVWKWLPAHGAVEAMDYDPSRSLLAVADQGDEVTTFDLRSLTAELAKLGLPLP
jgi:WD40 repeat protein